MKKIRKIAWKKLNKDIKEAKKNPKFMKDLKAFVDFHSGKSLD